MINWKYSITQLKVCMSRTVTNIQGEGNFAFTLKAYAASLFTAENNRSVGARAPVTTVSET